MISIVVHAQIGIGTTTPDASSILDVSSTEKGMLTPRMTTAQRTAIVTPANGLIVYDTDLRSFYYYVEAPTSSWVPVNSSVNGRTNFKRIKSTDNLSVVLAAELAAGGGSVYKLNEKSLYEINGTINLNFPIELNNASIVGLDSGEDKLIRASGNLFVGSTGGYIKLLTVSAPGKIFDIVGVGSGVNIQNLIFRDMIVVNSGSVGSLENFGLVFSTIVQYVNNNDGIVYKDIGKLLLENQGWFANNQGTFEKLEGTFDSFQKQGGFSEVNGTYVGLDVSSNPDITGNAVMSNVNFSGTPTSGKYVKGYTLESYPNYNFTNDWYVDSPGIPREGDAAATGTIYKNNRDFIPTNSGSGVKVNTPTTQPKNLFRFTSTTGRLTYEGKKPRAFQATCTISFEGTGSTNSDTIFYFVRINGTMVTALPETETYTDTKTGSIISNITVTGTIVLAAGESVELYAQRLNGSNGVNLVSYNLSLK
ncbi:hypothetical protein [Flavobacterium sp. TAB 87]|uniref:hypothetical protein n=1 Tax=Flavobacterium sp. TAB 87 TaxID=1729581 RepID=UPI00076D1544|nr:hypothetical protein [Flavobacterium sp. TAB 87]KVV15718.1 hypothetical protein AP058_00750 [Flavobacterium sp. TAB 87]